MRVTARADRTYPVCNGTRHGSNHGNATAIAPPDHLTRHSLRSHEDTGHIDLEHRVGVLSAVVQRRGLLLDTSCGDQAIEMAVGLGDVANDLVQLRDIADVDLSVVEGIA